MRRDFVLAVLTLSACQFDASVAADATIQCESNAECPTGWLCSRLQKRCQRRDDNDVVAPVLSGALSRTLMRPGESLTVTVAANEPLTGGAVVEARAASSLRALAPQGDGVFTFTAANDERDGLVRFFGSAADLAGNESQGIALGAALIDGTPPAVSHIAAPSIVGPGSQVAFNVAFSEEVQSGARLVVTRADGSEVDRRETTANTTSARFEVTLSSGEPRGPLTSRVEALIDLAGNTGVTVDGPSLTVDADGPVISAFEVSGRRFSAQAGFDSLVVPAVVAGASAVQVCLENDCRDATDAGSVRFTITTPLGAGPRTVLVRAHDEVGNRAELAEVVFLDFAAPIGPAFASPRAAAAPGASVGLTASFDEVLAPGVRLDVFSADGGLLFTDVSSVSNERVLQWVVPVPSGTASQQLALRLSGVQDLVGNGAPASLSFGSLDIDADPPTITPPGLQGRHFSAKPGFNVVSVPVLVGGATSVTVCLDRVCRAANNAQTVTFDVTLADAEGPHTISVVALDEVRNRADVSEVVVFDFTPPQVLAATVSYVPSPGCPMNTVSAATIGATARTFFAIDEALATAPVVTAGSMTFTALGASTQSFTFSFTVPSGVSSGSTALVARLVDAVGNTTTSSLGSMVIDVTPPSPLSLTQREGVLFRRIPYGAEESGGRPDFTVEATAGSFSGVPLVRFATSSSGALILGSLAPSSNGALSRTSLSVADQSTVYFQRFTDACTPDPGWSAVSEVEWVGTASTSASPLRFDEVPVSSGASRREPVARTLTSEVSRVDAQAAVSGGSFPRWRGTFSNLGSVAMRCAAPFRNPAPGLDEVAVAFVQQGSDLLEVELPAEPNQPVRAKALHVGIPSRICAYDSTRQRIVMSDGTVVWEYDGVGWQVLRPTPRPPAVNSLGMLGSLIALGGNGTTWSWDGVSWTNLGAGGPSGVEEWGPNPSMAVDPNTGQLMFMNMYLNAQQTVRFDGASWSTDPTYAPFTNPRGVQGATSSAEFIGFDGVTAARWDGRNWFPISAPSSACSNFLSGYSIGSGFLIVGDDLDQCRRSGYSIFAGWADVPRLRRVSAPPALSRAQVMRDPMTGKLVAYAQTTDGGWDGVFDRQGVEWTARGRGVDGGQLVFNTLALSPDAGQLWLFGLSNLEPELSRWVDGGFEPLAVAGLKPSRRTDVALATNHLESKLFLFGGRILAPTTPVGVQGDFWSFDGSSWTRIVSTNSPAPRAGAAMGWDPQRNVLVLFGGRVGSLLADTWEWSANQWINKTPLFGTPGPEPRTNASLVWDARIGQLLLTSGTASSAETWGWNGSRWTRLTQLVGAPLEGVTGFDGTSLVSLSPTHEAALEVAPGTTAHRLTLGLDRIVPVGASLEGLSFAYWGGAPAGVAFSQWNGWNWNPPSALGIAEDGGVDLITSFDADLSGPIDMNAFGIQFVPDPSAPDSRLRTDYVEARVRYVNP